MQDKHGKVFDALESLIASNNNDEQVMGNVTTMFDAMETRLKVGLALQKEKN